MTWIAGLILGFGLLQWSVEGGLVPRPSLSSQFYMSGETFFTLGYGDIVPQTLLGRFIGVVDPALVSASLPS